MISEKLSARSLIVGLMLTGVLSVYVLHSLYFIDYTNDDAYITFRYSRFLAEGNGPYFNPGERVEGYSNFLLMLLLSVPAFFDPWLVPPAAKWIGFASGLSSLVTLYFLTRLHWPCSGEESRFVASLAGILAVGVAGVNPGFAINGMSGLETLLFSFLITLGVYLGQRSMLANEWKGSGAAFSAAVLTRPEGVAIFCAYWTASLALVLGRRFRAFRDPGSYEGIFLGKVLRSKCHLWIDLATVAATIGAHLLFRVAFYDGEWLPNTYFAKLGGANLDTWDYIDHGIFLPVFGVVGALAGCVGILSILKGMPWILPVMAASLTGAFLPCLTGPDWMIGWRFEAPYVPLFASWVALGWIALAMKLAARHALFLAPLILALLVLLWIFQENGRSYTHHYIELRSRGYETGHRALADWLRNEASPGDTIALMDIGIVGYRCIDQTILDITGLTDRFIAKSPGPFLAKRYDVDYILDKEPEFIVLVFWGPRSENATQRELRPWTIIDSKILSSQKFKNWYRDSRPDPASNDDALKDIGKHLGAIAIFEHSHPLCHYYLVAFQRRERLAGQREIQDDTIFRRYGEDRLSRN